MSLSNNPYLDNIRAGRIGPVEQGILARVPGSLPELNAPDAPAPALPAAPGAPGAPAEAPRPIAGPAPAVRGLGTPPAMESSNSLAIVKPKPPSPAMEHYETLRKSGSGISQIKSPFARIPLQIADAIGSTFLPALTMSLPGTELHHRILENRAAGAVNAEAKRDLESAQAEHYRAEAGKITNPPVEYGSPYATSKGVVVPQKGSNIAKPLLVDGEQVQAPERSDAASRTITTDQGIMQWNPETQRYDIQAGNAPGAKGGSVQLTDEGDMIIVHPDGTGTAVTVDGKPVKGKATGVSKDDKAIGIKQEELLAQAAASGKPITEKQAYMQAYNWWVKENKINPGVARAWVFVNGRMVPVLDAGNGNAPTFATTGEIRENRGQFMPTGPGMSALSPTALIEDIRGGARQVREQLNRIPEFSATDKVKIAIALRSNDPRSALGNLLSGAAASTLTPDQQDYLITVTNLIENAMSLRSALKAGQGSEDVRAAIIATIPGPSTPDKRVALKKLDMVEQTLDRVERGIPKVKLRTDLGTEQGGGGGQGGGGSTPAQGGYKVGTVYGGMKYLGGDPNNEASWEKVKR